MHKTSALSVLVASLFAATALANAQGSTSIIKPISFGISGGVAVPQGDLSNGSRNGTGFTGVNTGYNATASLAIALPALPFGLRGDASYNSFRSKHLTFPQNAGNTAYNSDARVASLTANVVYQIALPAPIVRPYLIGGIGAYNTHFSGGPSAQQSSTSTGFNVGAGVALPLILANTFIEARYHRVNASQGTIAYIPITVGIMF